MTLAQHYSPRRSGRIWIPAKFLSLQWWRLGSIPSSARSQAMLAEIMSQGLAAEMGLVDALKVASHLVRGFRFSDELSRIAGMVESGEQLGDSFRWAGLELHADLIAAIHVGESRGRLAEELSAAAHRLDPRVDDHVACAIGRRRTAREFARSLARLLATEPMTVHLIHDAARLVGAHDRQFKKVIRGLALDIEGGCPFADALTRYPAVFDPLFIRCVASSESRDSLRRILSRVGA